MKDKAFNGLNDIGFIGAGKVGCSLGKYLSDNGEELSGYYSRSYESASKAAKHTGSTAFADMNDLISSSDTLFITVPDGEISGVWDRMRKADLKGKTVIHTSGAHSTSLFSGISESGAFGFSLHPLCAVSDSFSSHNTLSTAVFTIERAEGASDAAFDAIMSVMANAGNTVIPISPSDKALYHAAAVMASNMVVGLSFVANEMLKRVGFDEANASKALNPLIKGAVDNICRGGNVSALTGPVERNDVKTVAKHLEVLNERERAIYKDLTKVLIDIANIKHPEQNYNEMEGLL